jgi:hypothetical protein
VIPKVGFGKLLRDFTAIYNYDKWAWLAVMFSVLFRIYRVLLFGSLRTKECFFASMFFDANFVVISVSAGLFEKNYAVNETTIVLQIKQR